MNDKIKFSDYTEAEFLALVRKICNAEGKTEEEDVENILYFEQLCQHPDGSDLIYYPRSDREDSPEGIVKEIKQWRAQQGLPGFKPE